MPSLTTDAEPNQDACCAAGTLTIASPELVAPSFWFSVGVLSADSQPPQLFLTRRWTVQALVPPTERVNPPERSVQAGIHGRAEYKSGARFVRPTDAPGAQDNWLTLAVLQAAAHKAESLFELGPRPAARLPADLPASHFAAKKPEV
jgi:hypothetical protein